MSGRAAAKFDRGELLAALDTIGAASVAVGVLLDLVIYGGSALMLASNFRFATEDADVAELPTPWPEWLSRNVAEIAAANGWSPDWLNDAVQFHLSPLTDRTSDHLELATFPRGSAPGLRVFVPSAAYMLALKLKAMRINDPVKGEQEADDIRNLLHVNGVGDIDSAIAVLARYFPRSAQHAERERFFLKHIWPEEALPGDPPRYPVRSR